MKHAVRISRVVLCYQPIKLSLKSPKIVSLLKALFTFHLVLFITSVADAQCTTGSEPECACTTAPVVCTVDLLDSYTFSMSSFQHPDDAPSPLCPGFLNSSSTPQNPTWFAFVAWCEDLTINVHPTNCVAPNPFFDGVQCAIYSDCSYTPVVCNVQASDCNTDDKILIMDDLTIGNTYYFMIDGCAGAYCDIEIDVFGTCGLPVIAPWSLPIDGPTEVCAGTSPTFTIEDLDGAADYHWYLDGVLSVEGSELITFAELWDTPGIYELCVDASNDPCIPQTDFPEPICITIEVFLAEAGTITANPNPVCPNETISISASGYNADAGYNQFIVITDLSGMIVEVVPGDAATWTYDMCGSFLAYSYNNHDNSSTGDPIIGQDISTLDCGDGCCDQDEILLEFVDTEFPVFTIQPPDLLLTCIDQLP